jgi:histidinol-phosphate aminotransferase
LWRKNITVNPKKSVLDIEPYVPGKSGATGNKSVIKLSSNETPLGTSSKALEAIKNSYKNTARYPDGSTSELRNKLAEFNKINMNNIICGNGSDEILSMFANCFASAGDEIVYTEHGFLVYPIATKAAGAIPIVASEKKYKASVEEIIKVCTNKTKVCFIANPNNPTGTYLTRNELIALREKLPKDCLLVIDSAYAEYVEKDDYTNGFDLVKKYNNVACTRTFSKIYGLAALRIGWAYASLEVIDFLNRIRLPFNINSIAQYAAIAAIQDKVFIQKAIKHNNIWKPIIEKELNSIGLKIVPGVANFVLTKFHNSEQANACYAYLEKNNIFVRKVAEYGLADCLRITVGLEKENIFLIKIIKEFIHNN